MFAKFSVKKPYTILVAVVAVIVLGVIAFTSLTPDLMPDIDLPYVVIATVYAGASPEKVESEVTRPIEQSMAKLDNVESISSTSAENYSTVILKFSDGTDLAAASVDISNALNALSGAWDETVGTPYLMKINPNMVATAVVAVDVDGMEGTELTAFVKDNVLSPIEGVTGVASVSASGMLEERVEVRISESKLAALNQTVEEAIRKQFEEGYAAIDDAEKQLAEGREQIEAGKEKLQDGRKQLAAAASAAENKLQSAEDRLSAGQKEIDESRAALDEAKAALLDQLDGLYAAKEQLLTLKEAAASRAALEQTLAVLEAVKEAADRHPEASEAIDRIISEMTDGQYSSYAMLLEAIDKCREALKAFEAADAMLKEQGYEGGLEDIDRALADLDEGIAGCEAYLEEIEAGYGALDAAQAELDKGKDELAAGKATAAKELAKGEKTIRDASAKLAASEEELTGAAALLEENREAVDEALKEALKAADVKNIITLPMVTGVLFAENFEMPAGYVSDGDGQMLVRVGDAFADAEELFGLVLLDMGLEGMAPVTLADAAEVTLCDNSDEAYARVNGRDGVLLSVFKQSNAATADVSDALEEKLASLAAQYEELHFNVLMNQGDYIDIIVGSVLQNMLVGAALAIIILLLFLRDVRPTFIVACSIPISVTFAIVLMYFSGVTINVISLAGLAAGVGMLVDNSIVVIENIYRLRAKGLSPVKAAVSGTVQMAGAVAASTLTTVCVFFPIVFVKGLTRQLFQDMALTITYSLVASLIVALTLIPAMSPAVLKRGIRRARGHERLSAAFRRVITFCLEKKLIALGVAAALLAGSAALAIGRGFTYMPEMTSTQLTASVALSGDAGPEDTKKAADEFAAACGEIRGVGTVGTMFSGGMADMIGMSGGSQAGNAATVYILLDEEGEKHPASVADALEELAQRMNDQAGEAYIQVSNGAGDSMSMLVGSGVSVTLYGDDLEKLAAAASEVSERMQKAGGVASVDSGEETTDPVLNIRVDKAKAMKEGLTVAQVYQEIASALKTSAAATTVSTGRGDYDVIVVSEKAADMDREALCSYAWTVTGRDGTEKTVKLADIADIEEGRTLASITRADQKRYVTVRAEVEEGRNVTLVAREVEKALKDYQAPAGVTYAFEGENESIMDAMTELVKMLCIGILLVYLIMVAQFQSLGAPFVVMFTIPLAFTGAFLALLAWGMEISIVAMIGFVMLVGIVVNNGIVLVDAVNRLRDEGMERREAIVEATVMRIRPILMTAMTTILAMLPIALGIGQGSSIIRPVAVACIGGLAYATLTTLLIVPVMYELLSSKKVRTVKKEDLEITDL